MKHTTTVRTPVSKLASNGDVASGQCASPEWRPRSPLAWKASCAAYVLLLAGTAGNASGQLTAIGGFQDMPGGVFYNIVNPSPCGVHYWEPFTIDVAGSQVTVTTLGSTPAPGYEDGPYYLGCFNFSSSGFEPWRAPRDPAVDPGDYIGNFNSELDTVFGDLIVDFSQPLTAFGFSSFQGWSDSTTDPDTVFLYDGPRATGNLLGEGSSMGNPPGIFIYTDFVGMVGDTPQIRSARFPIGGQGFMIDGIAIALGAPCVAPSISVQPEPATTCGAGGTFSVTPAGTEPITVQWQVESPADSDTYVDVTEPTFVEGATDLVFDVSGATATTLVVSNVDLGTHPGTIRFRAAVSNACGNAASDITTLTVAEGVAQDLDLDCDVDAGDLLLFESCALGPAVPLASGCEDRDFDGDNDADQGDFGIWQRCYSGQNNPANMNCAN